MVLTIVGIDCATTDAKIGVARGTWSTDKVEVLEVALCGPERSAVALVTAWLRDSDSPGLIAIDAPLGWP